MAAPTAFSLYKTKSFQESFPKIKILGRKVDFFLQCSSYDALIPVSVKAEKRLDIFEEAVLKLIAYKTASKEEMADILCLSKDLVSFIMIRLQEAGLLEKDGYTVSDEGKRCLDVDLAVDESVETVQAKIFVLRKTGEILPYIHIGEFETEYVSGYTPDSMAIEYGTAGNPVKIRGKCLRHRRTGDEPANMGYQNGNMLKADKIRSAIRLFNRIAERDPRLEKIVLDEKYAIENTRSEDINFHMQAVVQYGNSDEILVSDGLVAHIDFVGRYIKQEYPGFIEKVKEQAVLKPIAGGKKFGEGNEGNEKISQPENYRELGKIWEKICRDYSVLKENYSEDSETPASGFSQDQYRNHKGIQKNLYIGCYSAMEWCFYCHCMTNPVSERILGVLESQTSFQNARTAEEFAGKSGIGNPQNFASLFQGVDGGKIRKMYRDPESVPNMNLCLPLALIEAAENGTSHMHRLLGRKPGLLSRIMELKNLRNDLQHQAKSEEINFGYDQELFELVRNCIMILHPDFILDGNIGESAVGTMDGSYSQERLNAEVSLSKALGALYFNSLLPEGLRDEWILISPDKEAERLPDAAGYVDILYRIMQETLYISIIGFRKDSSLSKDEILKEAEKREGKRLPAAIRTVKETYLSEILQNQRSTLGAHALVYMYAVNPERADELVHMGYFDIIGKIADLRKHGNNVALQVDLEELNHLRSDVIALCKKIGGE